VKRSRSRRGAAVSARNSCFSMVPTTTGATEVDHERTGECSQAQGAVVHLHECQLHPPSHSEAERPHLPAMVCLQGLMRQAFLSSFNMFLGMPGGSLQGRSGLNCLLCW
jgi:hypothetical protein